MGGTMAYGAYYFNYIVINNGIADILDDNWMTRMTFWMTFWMTA